MFSVIRGNKSRGMLRVGAIGGVALTFFFYCLLTGNDDVLRGRPSRTVRAARADFDHDTHCDGCFTLPSTAGAHDSLDVFIRTLCSGQTASHPVNALVTERIAVPVPDLTNDPVAAAVNLSSESRDLLPAHNRGPPLA